MREIDDIDARILRELQRNADQPLDQLSEAVSLSRNACWRRIRILQEAGVIKARVALLDPEKLGLTLTVFMQIKAARHDSISPARPAACLKFRRCTA